MVSNIVIVTLLITIATRLAYRIGLTFIQGKVFHREKQLGHASESAEKIWMHHARLFLLFITGEWKLWMLLCENQPAFYSDFFMFSKKRINRYSYFNNQPNCIHITANDFLQQEPSRGKRCSIKQVTSSCQMFSSCSGRPIMIRMTWHCPGCESTITRTVVRNHGNVIAPLASAFSDKSQCKVVPIKCHKQPTIAPAQLHTPEKCCDQRGAEAWRHPHYTIQPPNNHKKILFFFVFV